MHGKTARPIGILGVFPGLVGDDDHALGALGRHLAGDLRHVQAALVGLAAGHGDGVVEQDLVGHVHAGSGRGADGEIAGMVIGAVAQVLEHVLALGKRRLADPVGAFAAHLGEAERLAVHPLRHEVAADAGIGAAAVRHAGGGVVRAAGAEIGDALGDVGGLGQRLLRLLQPRHIGGDLFIGAVAQQPLADADGDVVGIERALDREQPVALLVLLADADRLIGGAVELLAHLHFDERALLLHHDDEVEAGGEIGKLLARDRPGAAELEDAQAEVVALDLVEAELVEGLAHVEIGLAGGDDADLRIAAAGGDHLVELVGAQEGEHGVALEVVQARFLAEDGVDQPDVEPAVRHDEVFRRDDLDALEAAVGDAGRFDRLVHAFERRPGAGEARHGPAVERVVHDLLHPGGAQDRHHHVDEMEFRLMRGGGGFRRVVVAHERDDAAVRRGAGEIGVAEDVAGAVDARPLAVPHAEDAIELAFAAQFGLLRAPERGGGQFLVDAGLELDVLGGEKAAGPLHLLIEAAERRAAVAGDIAGGVEPGAPVQLLLHQQGADQRLVAGHEDVALGEVVLVVEADGMEGHGALPCAFERKITAGGFVPYRPARPSWEQGQAKLGQFVQRGCGGFHEKRGDWKEVSWRGAPAHFGATREGRPFSRQRPRAGRTGKCSQFTRAMGGLCYPE